MFFKTRKRRADQSSSRRREIVKIRAQNNQTSNRKTIEKINKINTGFLKNNNRTDKSLKGWSRKRIDLNS